MDEVTIAARLFAAASAPNVLDFVQQIDGLPIRPKLRAAIYAAIALVPGIRLEGRARSLTGRVGVALGTPEGVVRTDVIIDPHTGSVLGGRTVVIDATVEHLPAGTVVFQQSVVERTITNAPGPPRKHLKKP